jgi:hypothetical protein
MRINSKDELKMEREMVDIALKYKKLLRKLE